MDGTIVCNVAKLELGYRIRFCFPNWRWRMFDLDEFSAFVFARGVSMWKMRTRINCIIFQRVDGIGRGRTGMGFYSLYTCACMAFKLRAQETGIGIPFKTVSGFVLYWYRHRRRLKVESPQQTWLAGSLAKWLRFRMVLSPLLFG